MNETQLQEIIEQVVGRVMNSLGSDGAGRRAAAPPAETPAGDGVFDSMDAAVEAAWKAFQSYRRMSLEFRMAVVEAIRAFAMRHREEFARDTVAETGIGRVAHKMMKFELVATRTPGVEYLTTWCRSGDHGLTIEELAPYGVIGAVTPVTHPVPTLLNNAISFLAAGNTAVFNAHPGGQRVFAKAVAMLNRALVAAGAPPNLITAIRQPTIESANTLFHHPRIPLLLVTGGPGVVKAALQAPKRAITAGPGNPPVIVDETANLARAARDIIAGAAFDNNVLCIGEKEVFVVDSVADALKREMVQRGCIELNAAQIEELAAQAFERKPGAAHAVVNRNFVGRNASVLAAAIGLKASDSVPLLLGEPAFEHAWVQEEQMMPFLPIVRCRDVMEAMDRAVEAEHGFRHTAIMHSKNIESMSLMAQRCDCSIFVKNGPSMAGLGAGGEGHTSFSIASPTGEGITTCRTFCRLRRCTLVDYFRIV